MILTLDEAMRQIDAFTDLVYGLVGQDCTTRRTPQSYHVVWGDNTVIRSAEDLLPQSPDEVSLEQMIERETEWLIEDGFDDD